MHDVKFYNDVLVGMFVSALLISIGWFATPNSVCPVSPKEQLVFQGEKPVICTGHDCIAPQE